ETGAVVSGKDARRWPSLRELVVTWNEGRPSIRAPNGDVLLVDAPSTQDELSQRLGRPVEILHTPPADAVIHRLWPAVEGLAPDHVRREATPVEPGVTAGALGLLAHGTFFDAAPIHVIFTSSLTQLRALS